MKQCFKCGKTKPLDDFYKHPGMSDGHLNKCKECAKQDARACRKENAEYYRAYEKDRSKLPHRVEARKIYQQSVAGKNAHAKASKKYRANHPEKRVAHSMVASAIRDHKISKPNICVECGDSGRVEAHHDDYSKPLDVRWLCPRCHRAEHDVDALGVHC